MNMSKYKARIAGQIRTALAAIGGGLVVYGVITPDDLGIAQAALDAFFSSAESLMGTATALTVALMSWYSKAKKLGGGDPE